MSNSKLYNNPPLQVMVSSEQSTFFRIFVAPGLRDQKLNLRTSKEEGLVNFPHSGVALSSAICGK